MAFSGWPVEAIEFFEGLEADNSRTYWTANKDVYERCVRAPMTELLEELAPEFGSGKLFRPYRDVRFSRDKSPYKTSVAASLSGGGYVHLTAEEFGAGLGMYMMAPDQLARFREAVAADRTGSELERLIASVERAGISVSSHDALKTAPKGYPKDHPRIDLLRMKGLICWQQWEIGAWLGTTEAKARVVTFLRRAAPVHEWLVANVGESTMEQR